MHIKLLTTYIDSAMIFEISSLRFLWKFSINISRRNSQEQSPKLSSDNEIFLHSEQLQPS